MAAMGTLLHMKDTVAKKGSQAKDYVHISLNR